MNRHTIAVKTLKELPGIKIGTIMCKPKSSGSTGDWMTPECMDEQGKYVPSYPWLHASDRQVDMYPDFFERIFCECKCCACMGCCGHTGPCCK